MSSGAAPQAPATRSATTDRTPPGAPSIDLRSLSKTYPGQDSPALADLSLTIDDGEFFSLLGPSGSGKTTTLRLIAGFETPDAGQVLLAGSDVSRTPAYRRDVNTVFQNYALFPHMTVLQNVQYPLRMRGRRGKSAAGDSAGEALELVGMSEFGKRLPHELSGGQRQRVALARAFVARPKVLLLDEPLGALDLQLRQQMQVVLKDLQSELGLTFIYVTHDQGEALAMSDRVAVMNHGRIEQCAPARDVYYQPSTRFVAGFIGKSNLLDCTPTGGTDAAWGDVRLRADADVTQATTALAVRYEAVDVSRPGQGPAGPNRFPARVRQEVFLGEGLELVLDVAGRDLVARVPAGSGDQFAIGDTVDVHIGSEHLRVLRG